MESSSLGYLRPRLAFSAVIRRALRSAAVSATEAFSPFTGAFTGALPLLLTLAFGMSSSFLCFAEIFTTQLA